MYAIIDDRAPEEAIKNLQTEFDVFRFSTKGITYEAVSCHPDIFLFCQSANEYIVAPNTPIEVIEFLQKHNATIHFGTKCIGTELKNSVQYNCITTDEYLFHKQGFTDELILKKNSTKKFISLPQAYTRCSMMCGREFAFTSDQGISNILQKNCIAHRMVSPEKIQLPPYRNGFIGGCCSLIDDRIYFIGKLQYHEGGTELGKYLTEKGLKIIELYDGLLYDGGGIFFGE